MNINVGYKKPVTPPLPSCTHPTLTAGWTLVVGAGYVALECAGFIAGLQQNRHGEHGGHGGHSEHGESTDGYSGVTVLSRSMLLRGFDRQMVKYVERGLVREGVRQRIYDEPR